MTQRQTSGATFNELPQMVEALTAQVRHLTSKVEQLHVVQVATEAPITTAQLCERLSITEQTAIAWRKANKIPFLRLDGVIRYDWNKVVAALETPVKSPISRLKD